MCFLSAKLTSHHTVAHHQFAVLRNHSGDDRVVRSLPALDVIGMAFLESESCSSVLKCESTASRYRTGSEAYVGMSTPELLYGAVKGCLTGVIRCDERT